MSVAAGRAAGARPWRPAVWVAVAVCVVAAGATADLDEALLQRVRGGSDNAVRLSAIYPYLGIDSSYTLARSFGVVSLAYSWLSLVVGLELSVRRSRSRPAPRWAGSAHRQLSLASLVLALGHATWPYTSRVPPYGGWATDLVPFGQPSSWGLGPTWWQSFGVLAVYLALLTGPTYYAFGSRRRAWMAVHRLSFVVYGLACAHAFLLGSDFLTRGWPRVALLAAQVPVAVGLGRRVGSTPDRARARYAMWLARGIAVGLAGLSIGVAAGAVAPGLRI